MRLTSTLLFILTVQLPVQAQNIQYPYYVTVGVFAIESNAIKYTAIVQGLGHGAEYAFNSNQKLYYVYVKVTDDRQEAKDLVYNLRSQPAFKGAWIYNGSALMTEAYAKANPIKGSRQDVSDKVDRELPNIEQPVSEEQNVVEPVQEVKVEPVPEVKELPVKREGKAFVFQLVNSVSGKPIIGDVRVVESERDTVYQNYSANEVVNVSPPKSGRLIIICSMVGYKFFKKAIIYDTPAKGVAGATTGSSQEIILPIKLTSVKRGDYFDLEKVRFFEHSAIMTPESEEELKELLNLMNSNPDFKIRIHGHTHSEASREITSMGESKNFFALDPANKHGNGSAKELSTYRAEIVKAYLVSNGVDAKRISSKGQGAALAIFGNGAANERVEVEIVRH